LNLAPRSRRLSRGLRLRAPLLALRSPILRGLSSLRTPRSGLAPRHVDGAAASRWARGRSRGKGEKNSLSLLYRYGTMRSTHRKAWRGLSASATRGIHALR
jgi:hypothetical protein